MVLIGMWKIHDDRFRNVVRTPAARELFLALESLFGRDGVKLPPALRQAKPFVISRDFGPLPWHRSNEAPVECYRFQYGPHSWSEVIYLHSPSPSSHSVPRYQQDAEDLARQLKAAKWEDLARPLIAPGEVALVRDGDSNRIQVTLCWQDDGQYCTVHDRQRGVAIAFAWSADGLTLLGEAHPHRLRQLENRTMSYERPVLPLEEGVADPKPAERAGRMDEFRAAIQWRYATRLDNGLDGLVLECCDRLDGIDGDIGMAFAGHRFNDACGDDSWLAVRHGNFAWENGAYFTANAESLRSASADVHQLLGLLVHLKTSGVGNALMKSYGYPVDALDVIGVFRQQGTAYLACCNSQGSCGPVYEIDPRLGSTSLCGFTDRFDWNFHRGSRAGGMIPECDVLRIMTLDELVRRVETGDLPIEGPPHDLDVAWRQYLPEDVDR